MKKYFGVVLIFIMALFAFTACSLGKPNGNGEPGDGDSSTKPPASEPASILIAYFSCTNKTEAIAKYIETETKGTLYEIVPKVPYTEDDLKYYTDCRADKEQADANARPAINGRVDKFEEYNVIFLGYPIWHGYAPRIISTFLESYDFSGKTIVPFCTSATSGIGSSDTALHALAPSAQWRSGRRFASNASQKSVSDWIEGFSFGGTASNETGQREITKMFLTINGNKLEVALAENSSVDALVEILRQGDITYTADDHGGFEKVGSLGRTLPKSDMQLTTQPGDVMLYLGNRIVLFYGSNTWSYTKIGAIQGYSVSELESLLGAGKGSVQVTISLN